MEVRARVVWRAMSSPGQCIDNAVPWFVGTGRRTVSRTLKPQCPVDGVTSANALRFQSPCEVGAALGRRL